ncbi:MAG: hypothetical protein POELPBGB_01340 [Bacteroidia bacterium]|nr:hypothetical protein [Bacteroidia bacterium]
MITLEEIKVYFGDACKTFPKTEKEIESKLTLETQKILYEIGLPNYKGYGGDYIMLEKLQLIDNQYLQFATRDFDEEYYKQCIDLKTGKVVFNLRFDYARSDGDEKYYVLNSDLESYLRYVFVFRKYMDEIELPQKLGDYSENHSKYSKELKTRLLKINNDVNAGFWANLIEEMDLGVI